MSKALKSKIMPIGAFSIPPALSIARVPRAVGNSDITPTNIQVKQLTGPRFGQDVAQGLNSR